MIFVLVFIIGIILYRMEFAGENFYLNYMSVEKTQSVKGIFVLLILLSHFSQYVELNNYLDQPYIFVQKLLGQLVVAMFLFYSGYGIMESIKKKKMDYINSIPRKRILKVLFDFDLAILMFILVKYLLGTVYQPRTILLSFIGWTSVGNSNWYIFVILVTYVITYLAFKIFKEDYTRAVVLVSILTGLYVFWVKDYKPAYTYNTIFCYVTGMWFSLYRTSFEKLILDNNRNYMILLIILITTFSITYAFKNKFINYQIKSLLFVLLVVVISLKVSFDNFILSYLGKHIFSIYILQRIPMMILKEVDFIASRTYLYLVFSVGITLIMSYIFDILTDRGFKKISNLKLKS